MKHIQLRLVISLILSMGATALYAQQDVDAAGGDAAGGGGSASFSIGQVVYTYVSGSNGSSNQGVQQPYEFFSTGIEQVKGISLTVTAYPNPTQSIVNLKIESESLDNLSFQLYDVAGKMITTQTISEALTIVPMQSLASGAYVLEVSGSGKTLKTFTIIKYN